jgi:hypothetical protein
LTVRYLRLREVEPVTTLIGAGSEQVFERRSAIAGDDDFVADVVAAEGAHGQRFISSPGFSFDRCA